MKLPKINLKEKVSKAGAAASSKLASAKKFTAVMLAVSFVLSAGFLAAPTLRKNSALGSVGKTVMADMKLIPEIIAYYDGNQLSALAVDPTNNNAYRLVSDALAKVRKSGGYESVMLIVQSGKQYLCAADSLLDSGFNAYAAGSLLSPDKSVKSLLNKIYDGKSAGGVAADAVEGRMGQMSACVLMPINGSDGKIAGVLAVETEVDGVPFHIAGAVNLYIVGAVFGAIALIMALLLFMFIKLTVKTGGDPVGAATTAAAATATTAAATVAAKTADAAMKKAVESRVKKAAEKTAEAPAQKAEDKKSPLSAAEIANSIFGKKKSSASDEVTSSNVAQKYPAPEFNDSTDFDTLDIPSLTLPGEEDV